MEIVFAGFGGQGVLTSGLIMAEIAMEAGKKVTWMPAFGATMRGGKAYSVVKYSDNEIGGPDMEEIDILVVMNEPSLEFAKLVKKGGMIFLNCDSISNNIKVDREDVEIVRIPCQSIAIEAKNPKAANVVTIGAIISKAKLFEKDHALTILERYFTEGGKPEYVKQNEEAFLKGYEYKINKNN